MDITETLYVITRKEWRAWLKANYKTKKVIWLIFYKKASGKPRISYNDAVEEALCFDWIDSTAKKIDDKKFAQRFSPRNPRSGYSQLNRERLRKLIKEGVAIKEVSDKLTPILDAEKFEIPADILRAIKSDKQAWKNFQAFPDAYKRIRVSYIDHSRIRPEEFQKRLAYFIKQTAANKMIGYVQFEDIVSTRKEPRPRTKKPAK
jgi:uncharacterized protein YdeI (YjbR/CyaY-like superfamily)